METTCPKWFSLHHEALLNNVEHKGASPFSPQKRAIPSLFCEGPDSLHNKAPNKDKANLREISPIQLTALVYYNRAIDFLAEKRFSDAAAANAKALRLDPLNTAARGNLLATINNWAIDLGNAGHYDKAAALLRRGLEFDPLYEAFELNFAHVHHQWSQELCKQGKYREAVELLNRAGGNAGKCVFSPHVWGVYRCWAMALLSDNKIDEAFDILRFMN